MILRFEFSNCTEVLNNSQDGQFIQINNSISQTIPLYMKGGSIISRASSSNSEVSNLTNSNLILHIGFEKNSSGYYVAEGKILGFTDLYNDSAMFQSCFVSKCLINVKAEASVKTTTQTHYEIKLSFSGDTAETLDIYITSAQFYGLNSTKCVSFNLGTSYQLKVPNSFTMNIYE